MTHIFETLAVARSLAPYSLGQMLTLETQYLTRGTTLIIVTASLDQNWVTEAQILSRRGIRPMCVLIDPASFGGKTPINDLKGRLQLARIPTVIIRRGDDLAAALAQRAL
jgi:hypothetical protein